MKVGDRVIVKWEPLYNAVGTILSFRNSTSAEVGFEFILPPDAITAYANQRGSELYRFTGRPKHSMFLHMSNFTIASLLSGIITSTLTSKIFKLDNDKLCILECVYTIKIGTHVTVTCIPSGKSYRVISVTQGEAHD